jgi:hypothetical protein
MKKFSQEMVESARPIGHGYIPTWDGHLRAACFPGECAAYLFPSGNFGIVDNDGLTALTMMDLTQGIPADFYAIILKPGARPNPSLSEDGPNLGAIIG